LLFEEKQKVLFIGDSITDSGRREINVPWGQGYVSMVRDFLLARYPELNLTVVNRGVSGDTTRHLLARWRSDVISEQPNWLSLKIGINDVWRGFSDLAEVRHEAVPLAEYRANLYRLLDQVQEQTHARLILMTPYMIEANRAQAMRAQMDTYGAVVKEIAAERGAVLVDTQAAFEAVLKHTIPDDWADDQIHPNGPGNAVIAQAFLRAVGFEL
jgi:lysophospholipase L1-like esterase